VLQALRAHPGAGSAYPFGDAVHYTDARRDRDGETIAAELRTYLRSRGLGDVRVAEEPPGIEDVFMALMRAPAAA
jgi:hypothetical protein